MPVSLWTRVDSDLGTSVVMHINLSGCTHIVAITAVGSPRATGHVGLEVSLALGWLVRWLVGWLVGWLVSSLVGWLVS